MVRRRQVAAVLALVLVVALAWSLRVAWQAIWGDSSTTVAASGSPSVAVTSSSPKPSPSPSKTPGGIRTPDGVVAPTPSPNAAQGEPGASADTTPVRILRLSGNLSSKSVDASARGMVFAQNMMYQHSMAAYGPDGALLKTIPDAVDLSAFGIDGHPGTSRGAPVEMAFSPDGKYAWVSNYHMYGKGFSGEPSDNCSSGSGYTNSYMYKVDTDSFEIVKVVPVGVVPKYVAMTPDGTKVIVTNWCSMDINIIDTSTDKVVATVPSTGRYPRGIAVAKDSKTAYIALMGSNKIVALDLTTNSVRDFAYAGSRTRHVTMSPDGTKLYATNSGDNNIAEIDVSNGKVLRKVNVGKEPRSMTVSADGGALYVVNYDASSMSKVRISDFVVTGTYPTDANPIGITYEATLKRVWVACYSGTILVFDDSRLKG